MYTSSRRSGYRAKYNKISISMRYLRFSVALSGALLGSLLSGYTVQARDMTGAWATDAAICNKIFTGTGSKLVFAEDADMYGSGFIYEKNRLKGKIATCAITKQKEEGEILHLITSCSTDVALATVQFSLKIDDDNKITRFFPALPELSIQYYRCSP